jgi:membrane-bound serine protease (ClpP class)
MFKTIRVLVLLGLLFTLSTTIGVRAASSTVAIITADGVINPVLADYIARGIEEAEDMNATACIIQMDTPGGLDTAMRDIVQEIVNARIPVVVYVSPSGARAASAGAFITIAAHVAAMAPSTAIGAASPVSISSEGEVEMSETMQEKVMNDAAALIRGLAETHGRNVEWAEKAVREAVSANESEALELNVIDVIAADINDLISKLDGWEVTLLGGAVVTIETQGAVIQYIDMSWMERFLFAITDPNIAYVLLSLATLGLFVEISNPGLIVPGVAGGICLILALYSLGNLPVNITGILLVAGAFGLFIAEVFTETFGLFTAGGITALVLGSLILFKGGPLFQVNPWLVGTIAFVIAAAIAFVITRVVASHRRQPSTGREELVGKVAVVKAPLAPEGMVLYKGERWTAISEEGRIESDEKVVIDRVDSLKLYVRRPKKESGS